MLEIMRRQLERNAVFLGVIMLVLAAFEFLLCAIVASMDMSSALGEIGKFAPPVLRAIIEQNLAGGSPAAVIAFGWNHPVAHALLAAVAIALPARAIAGEVENGAIEFVMAQPVSRAQYFAAHVLLGAGALAAVVLAGVLGTVIGMRVYSVEAFGASRLAALFANVFLLQVAIYAVTLLASAIGRESGRVALIGVLIAVISFLVNALAALWEKAAFAKPWSLHGYFEPRVLLVQDRLELSSLVVLAAVSLVAIAIAFAVFSRRDLP
jgi:ABC-2 type transport system permease protein